MDGIRSQVGSAFFVCMVSLLASLAAPTVAGEGAMATENAMRTGPSAERLLPLRHAINARDLGGYATADGRTVKWGVLYRRIASPNWMHRMWTCWDSCISR